MDFLRRGARLAVLFAALAAMLAPAAASAHPLGNFSINRFSRIETSGPRLYVVYVLDMAEFPSYQAAYEAKHLTAGQFAARLAEGVHLSVDGTPVTLRPVKSALAHPPGAGGLTTTRVETVLEGPLLTHKSAIAYADGNYAGQPGWREIVVGAHTDSVSHDLSAYPKDMLAQPLKQTSVKTSLTPGSGAAVPPTLDTGKVLQAPDRVADSGFTALIGNDDLSLLVILASLGAALFWGAAHALSPGHGKTIVTAYLVGRRGTPWHAALLGLIVTATHTVGVFALGLITLALSQFIVPEDLYPWLNLTAGLLVVAIGAWVLLERVRVRWGIDEANGHGHAHGHGHSHGHAHGHGHSHGEEREQGLKGLVAVGISGGLLPCPSALVVLLAAISLHRVGFGLALIVAFSLGLALSITGIGLIAVLAKRAFSRVNFEGRLISYLPAASSLVIFVAGIAMTVRAIPTLAT
jgi:nickel/cobalt exporter